MSYFDQMPDGGLELPPWAWRVLEAVFVLALLGLLYMALC